MEEIFEAESDREEPKQDGTMNRGEETELEEEKEPEKGRRA